MSIFHAFQLYVHYILSQRYKNPKRRTDSKLLLFLCSCFLLFPLRIPVLSRHPPCISQTRPQRFYPRYPTAYTHSTTDTPESSRPDASTTPALPLEPSSLPSFRETIAQHFIPISSLQVQGARSQIGLLRTRATTGAFPDNTHPAPSSTTQDTSRTFPPG